MSVRIDAIIVGSGAGGGTAARVLTERGFNVVVLEKGEWRKAEDFLPFDELHFTEHGALTPPPEDCAVYVSPSDPTKTSRVERWWVANMVGGSTMIWDANLPRYTKEDFAISSVMPEPPPGASMVDWPWRYDDWHGHFERAEWEWGVSGRANQSPAQEPTRDGYDYPMSPLRQHGYTPLVMSAFAKVGMTPYLSPRGINSRTYDSRPGCPLCGFCQSFGCAANSRASSVNTMLARALRTGRCEIRTGHYVTRIVHQNGRVRGVEFVCEPGSKAQVMQAPLVLVSVQAIESARLFLLSEIPNPNVGRHLTYHTKGSVELTFPGHPAWDEGPLGIYQPRTAIGMLQIRDLYVIRDKNRPELNKGGKFSVYDSFTCTPPIDAVSKAGFGARKRRGLWGRDLVDRLVELRNQGGVSFSFTGEAISQADNRVELDPAVKDPWGIPVARTTYRHHRYDMETSKYCLERVAQIMTDAGGEIRKFNPQGIANEGYGHNHGTLRAGRDPAASVLDAECQSHDVKGLYVLDCAFMPTSGATNPTLTMIANAYRVAGQIPQPH